MLSKCIGLVKILNSLLWSQDIFQNGRRDMTNSRNPSSFKVRNALSMSETDNGLKSYCSWRSSRMHFVSRVYQEIPHAQPCTIIQIIALWWSNSGGSLWAISQPIRMVCQFCKTVSICCECGISLWILLVPLRRRNIEPNGVFYANLNLAKFLTYIQRWITTLSRKW